jgi:hypothetical protein
MDLETNTEIAPSKILTGQVGQNYSIAQLGIGGYKCILSPINANGTYTKDDILVVFVYSKEIQPKELIINNLNTNVTSPQNVGTEIELTADASGEGTLNYKFVANLNGKWIVIKDFAIENSVKWTPKQAGNYEITVVVKDSTGKSVSKKISYKISSSLAITSFKSNLLSPQKIGTAIILSATGTGVGTLKYRFCVNDGTNLTVLKDFSTTNTVQWIPKKAGTYIVSVGLVDSTGKAIYTKFSYIVKSDSTLAVTSFKPNLISPQKVGAKIQLWAQGTGQGTLKYRFCVNDGINLTVLKDFGAERYTTWAPNKAGTYIVSVGIEDATGVRVYQKFAYVVN